MEDGGAKGAGEIERLAAAVTGEIVGRLKETAGWRPEDEDRIAALARSRVLDGLRAGTAELAGIVLETAREELTAESRKRARKEKSRAAAVEMVQRFNLQFRIQHVVMFVSVIILILTGLPLKFPDVGMFSGLLNLMGGIGVSRLLHRIAAVMLIGVSVYHVFYTVLARDGRRDFILLFPRPKDVTDLFKMLGYFLGRGKEKPAFGRFSYIEKFDYWAVYWGCVIMITSGAFLWWEDISLRFFPKYILDISKEVHSDEALLATLALVIWHFYNVHFNPEKFPGSLTWWHGKITMHELREHHALEYEEMTAGKKNG